MTNEPDKLAEAIEYYSNVPHGVNSLLPILLEAARAYHDLPVVDEWGLKNNFDSLNTPEHKSARLGWEACVLYLNNNYPQGLKWK